MANASYTPPGRLGNPDMSLATDPRTNPKVLKALQAFGLAGNLVNEVPEEWTIESLAPLMAAQEQGTAAMYEMLENDLPTDVDEPAIDISEQTIKGVDDNDIKLYIYKPADAKGPLPAVIYTHGGGMVSVHTSSLEP